MRINNQNLNFTANKMTPAQAHYFENLFKNSKSIDIICHEATDRDSANSACVMYDYLVSLGINSRIILSQNLKTLNLRDDNYNIIQAKDVKDDLAPSLLLVDFSAKSRMSPNIYSKLNDDKNIYCIDHHNNPDLSKDMVYIEKPLEDYELPENVSSFYVDASAKSATSVIYQFFNALGKDIDKNTAYDLFSGLADDLVKKGYIKCDGENGLIIELEKLKNNENASKIFKKLQEKLTDDEISEIAKKIDILSSLTKEEIDFRNSLYEHILYSKNKKIAYVELAFDDEKWRDLNGDNTRTSTILNRFRQEVLSKNPNLEGVFVFYEANGAYRLSAHTRKNNLLEFFKYIEDTKIPEFTKHSGGHPARGGAGIIPKDKNDCHAWVEAIIDSADFFEKY